MKPPIAVFAVYGEGHVNRLLPIVEAFVRRGHRVHMWAPGEFGPRITSVGAQFVDLFAGRSLDSVDASLEFASSYQWSPSVRLRSEAGEDSLHRFLPTS